MTIASHCPLQKPTAERMAAYLARVPRRAQRVAYLTNIGGRRVRAESAAVLDDLAQAVAWPVQWYDAMRLMSELARSALCRCHPGMPWRHCRPAPHPPCRPCGLRTTGSSALPLRARRSSCTSGRRSWTAAGEGVGSEPAGDHEHGPGHNRPDHHHKGAVLQDLFVEAISVDALCVSEDQRTVR